MGSPLSIFRLKTILFFCLGTQEILSQQRRLQCEYAEQLIELLGVRRCFRYATCRLKQEACYGFKKAHFSPSSAGFTLLKARPGIFMKVLQKLQY